MKRFIKKLGLFCVYTIIFLYIAFLIVPFALNPFISSYSKDISKLAEDTCGLKIKIEGLKLVTTPKLTAGVRIKEIGVNLPSGESVVAAENMQAKISLLPLLLKKVEADMFSIDYIDANLAVKPDGTFLIADYLPASDDNETKEQLTELPLGLKLSNRLPNVYIKEYLLSLTDLNSKKSYTLQGSNLKVTDFVLDKNIKFSAAGFAKLDKEPLFNFNIKVANYIMPNINLNDLVFVNGTSNNTPETSSPDEQFKISDIFKIFEGIKKMA